MTHSLQHCETSPGIARTIPQPFTAAALFLNGTSEPIATIEDLLDQFEVPNDRRAQLWVAMIYDRGFSDHAIAQAAYGAIGDQVVRHAMFIHPLYWSYDLNEFLDGLGSALFGSLPVVVHRPEGVANDV